MTTETTQDCPMTVKPQREHEWLQQFIGEWTWESECNMGLEQPAWKSTGSERVRAHGELWVIGEGESDMPDGGRMQSLITIGFDPQKQQFVGTFVASVMAHLWVYERGELDAAGHTLTLYAQGPNMSPDANGAMTQYRDVIEMKSRDHRVMRSSMLNDDGTWTQFMQAHYHRK